MGLRLSINRQRGLAVLFDYLSRNTALRLTGITDPLEDALLWLDIGRPDHLAPPLGFVGNEFPELGR